MATFSFTPLDLDGACLVDCFHSEDSRGGFMKNFEKEIYENAGIVFNLSETFVSVSGKNVIRGLHFQRNNPQAKLVSVLRGRAYDVIVDLREKSSTFGKWRGVDLNVDNHRAFYVPSGFAHGFLSLEDDTIMLYQCDGKYDGKSDGGIRFDDPDIAVEWPTAKAKAILSEKDRALPYLRNLERPVFREGRPC